MRRKIVLFLSILFVLTGCWDIQESDRMNYVHGLGIDYKDGQIIVYLQIVNFGSLGTPDVAAENENQVSVATSSADTITSAVHNIYQSAQQRLYWGHDTFIIFSEEALKHQQFKKAIDLLKRFPYTRYRILVYATNDNIKDIFNVTTLFQNSAITTRITDLENTYEQSSRIPQMSMRELIIQVDEPGHNGIIPAITLTEDTWESEQKPIKMIKDIGVGIITPNQFNGFVLNDDINGLRWTLDSERNNVGIYKGGQPASDIIVLQPKQTYTIETNGNDVTFRLKIRAEGYIYEMIQDVDQDFIIKELEKTIEKEVMHTYKKALELKSDIYRLSEKLYRRHLKTWKKVEKDGEIELDENSLVVDVEIELIDTRLGNEAPSIEPPTNEEKE